MVKRQVRITAPIPGKEMIIENIDDHPAVMAVVCMQPLAALPCDGVFVCKSIDGTMQQDTMLYLFREAHIPFTRDTIRDKITYGDLIIPKRKVDMGQKIHEA